ncbi:hypothetical protein C0J52_19191 [Blattella germanica]|nr:hypothetical protein C0J52_19191 [Blattella germanica]
MGQPGPSIGCRPSNDDDDNTLNYVYTHLFISVKHYISLVEVDEFSNKIAQVFHKAGYRKGDVVGLFMANCPEYICIWFGLAKLGVITALININLRSYPLVHSLNVAKAKGVIASEALSSALQEVVGDLDSPVETYQFGGKPTERTIKNLNVLMQLAPNEQPSVESPGYKDKLLYIYTSGTTGLPKAAVLPHSRYLLITMAAEHLLALEKDDIIYNPLPLYHTAGGVIGTGPALVVVNLDNKIGAVGCIPQCVPSFVLPVGLIKVDPNTNEPIRNEKGLCIRCGPNEPGDILVADDYGYLYFKDRTGDTFRWKGENVATAEVESVIINVIGLQDAAVYGVQVPEQEGKAGMAAIADPNNMLDFKSLADGLDKTLPMYARPIFIRVLGKLDMTGTFKIKKNELQNDGFDPIKIKDKLYFRSGKEYVPLTTQLYQDILKGVIRV